MAFSCCSQAFVPEGHLKIAQRFSFSGGFNAGTSTSPEGTAECCCSNSGVQLAAAAGQ